MSKTVSVPFELDFKSSPVLKSVKKSSPRAFTAGPSVKECPSLTSCHSLSGPRSFAIGARAAIWVGFYGLWPIAPEPVQGVGEYLAGMFLIVAAVAEGVIDVVSGKLKRTEHRLVGEPPIAAL